MPFGCEQPEIAFRLVVKPVIERVFGGQCVRYTDKLLGDWRRTLRREMLYAHLIVFDLSFYNDNVRREKAYYDTIAIRLIEKKCVSIAYRFERDPLQFKSLTDWVDRRVFQSLPHDQCFLYDCNDVDFKDLSQHLIHRCEAALLNIGFTKGYFDPWVCYPKPPRVNSNLSLIETDAQAFFLEGAWVDRLSVKLPAAGDGSKDHKADTRRNNQ